MNGEYSLFRPIISGGELHTDLAKIFKQRLRRRKRKKFREDLAMIGLLFARPTDPFAKEHIVPELDYFSVRSGHNIDFFCIGYTKKPRDKRIENTPPVAIVRNVQWWFDNSKFDNVRTEIERESKWVYSGESELVLANARSVYLDKTEIDYSSAICCRLEKMKDDKAIESVREFFEKIFRYSEYPKPDDPTFGMSDEFGKRVLCGTIRKIVFSLLPKGLADDYNKAEHFVISDLSKSI